MFDRKMYTDRIMKYSNRPYIKILTGMKGSGKSTILKIIQEKLIKSHCISQSQIITRCYDSLPYSFMNAHEIYEDLRKELSRKKRNYLFLEDVQIIDGWQEVINTLISDFDVDVYLECSRKIPPDILSCLTRPQVCFEVFPLSFAEFLEFRKNQNETRDNKQEFSDYLRQGGFPKTHFYRMDQDSNYTTIQDLYRATILKEICPYCEIRKYDQLERVIKYIFQNVGSWISAKTIAEHLTSNGHPIQFETVSRYLNQLEMACLIHPCQSLNLKGRVSSNPRQKFYLADHVLLYSLLGHDSDNIESSLGNIVYLELKRRGYSVYPGNTGDGEVDFVAVNQDKKLYIHIPKLLSSQKTEEREYGRLFSIQDHDPKYVLRTDDFAGGNYEGIITMHVSDFLLSEEF